MTKKLILIFLCIGTLLGGYLPLLWGGSTFSLASVILSGIGGLAGVYTGYRLSQTFDN